MKKTKIGFIGSGSRAGAYATNLKNLKNIAVEYAAICDINPEFANRFNQLYAEGKAMLYDDYREMLRAHPDLTGVVIATPDDEHEGPAIACLKANMHIILEKPLAHTPLACLNILRAAQAHRKKSVTLGFVLRYTSFYRKIKEVLDSGLCGSLLTINAEEIIGPDTTRLMFGGWRRKTVRTGGLLLEKCCHDLDIFNWLTGKLPVRVQSLGGLKAFIKNPLAGPRCRDCRISGECAYFFDVNQYTEQVKRSHEWRYMLTWSDTCLFDGESDICDHQTVSLEYEDGAVLNLMITLGCDLATRTIRVIGTRGWVEGDISRDKIKIGRLKPSHQETLEIVSDGSGHHGGDGEICRAFERSILDSNYQPSATIEAGFHGAMVAFAAERARLEKRPVEIAECYQELGLKPGQTENL